jgi:hypothetical protein
VEADVIGAGVRSGRWRQAGSSGAPTTTSGTAPPRCCRPGGGHRPDNYTTHNHAKVQAWLASHPRIHLHFTSTYASWLNLVEVFVSIIEGQALRRGDVASVGELVAAIRRFCDGWNQRCQPFTWTKDADQIFAKFKRPTAM